MALTKPAGVALQLLSIPVFFIGLIASVSGLGAGAPARTVVGVAVLACGAWLLRIGGRPARASRG